MSRYDPQGQGIIREIIQTFQANSLERPTTNQRPLFSFPLPFSDFIIIFVHRIRDQSYESRFNTRTYTFMISKSSLRVIPVTLIILLERLTR